MVRVKAGVGGSRGRPWGSVAVRAELQGDLVKQREEEQARLDAHVPATHVVCHIAHERIQVGIDEPRGAAATVSAAVDAAVGAAIVNRDALQQCSGGRAAALGPKGSRVLLRREEGDALRRAEREVGLAHGADGRSEGRRHSVRAELCGVLCGSQDVLARARRLALLARGCTAACGGAGAAAMGARSVLVVVRLLVGRVVVALRRIRAADEWRHLPAASERRDEVEIRLRSVDEAELGARLNVGERGTTLRALAAAAGGSHWRQR